MEDTRTDNELLQLVWDYMSVETPLQPADAIIVGGCRITGLAEYAAELYHSGLTPLIVFSGYQTAKMDTTEADLLADIAQKHGVPESAILRERLASNTGDNITFSARLLERVGIIPKTVILIHKPFMSRRFLATAEAQWPSPQPQFIARHEAISMKDYEIKYGRAGMIRGILGDFSRIERYAKSGHQSPQTIPAKAQHAFEIMAWRGHQIR